MEIRKMHIMGLIAGLILLAVDAYLYFGIEKPNTNLSLFVGGIAFAVILLPFVISTILDSRREQNMAEMFLEFSRNLAESVNVGTPISKSIVNMSNKNYGNLSPYIKKLANQISLGIPVSRALENFARDVDNKIVYRAISLIREAERAGGEIDYILASVATSIAEVEKLKKERQAAISNLIVQGYIIFFVFIGIVLILEFNILPITKDIGGLSLGGGLNAASLTAMNTSGNNGYDPDALSTPFLYLLVTQGIFAGLTIGKLSEGSIKAGVKHSFIMATAAFLISTGAKVFFG